MANFEGLIRQALVNQNAVDPAVRQRVYQSSRNALIRMLDKAGNLPDEAVRNQFAKLEESIASIEAEFAPAVTPAQEPEIETPPVQPDEHASEKPASPEMGSAPEHTITTAVTDASTAERAMVETAMEAPASPHSGVIRSSNPVLAMLEKASMGTAGRHSSEVAAPYQQQAEPVDMPSPQPASRPADDISTPSEPDEPSVELTGYEPAPLFPPLTAAKPEKAPRVPDLAAPAGDPVSAPQAAYNDLVESEHPNGATASGETRFDPAPFPEDRVPDTGGRFSAPDSVSFELDREDVIRADDRPAEESASSEVTLEEDAYPVYKRRNPILRRLWPIALVLGVLLVILWILYAVFVNMGDKPSANNPGENPGPVGQTRISEDGTATITLLEPTDLSALVTAGRGTAELITEQAVQMLRLQSVRQQSGSDVNAEPILLELERGVLQQVLGKQVTVELHAKSGLNGPAQFAIECDIGGDSVCGRKRFRVGQQPEKIVFSMDLTNATDSQTRAFLALNTDITTLADSSGKGDIIDVIYARLRFTP